MIVHVDEGRTDARTVHALNALHAPTVGIVVVHAPPSCGIVELASEVLWALGRPPEPKTPTSDLMAWAEAWLATASPRCDLMVYGSARLRNDAHDWLTSLGGLNAITVWMIKSDDDLDHGTAARRTGQVWDWSSFIKLPWTDRYRERASTSSGVEGGEHSVLPPFPWSRRVVGELPSKSYAYAVVGGLVSGYIYAWDDIRSFWGRGNLAGLGALCSVAHLALITRRPGELSVLLRTLEEDVFVDGGLLITDPEGIGGAVACHYADGAGTAHERTATHFSQHASPADSLGVMFAAANRGDRSASVDLTAAVVAADGSSIITRDGVTYQVPPWWRWAARACAHLERLVRCSPRQPIVRMPDTRPYAAIAGPRSRIGDLIPLIEAIKPYVKFYSRGELETSREAADAGDPGGTAREHPTLTPAAARALLSVADDGRSLARCGRVSGAGVEADDEGLQWLLCHGLVHREAERGTYVVAPWIANFLPARMKYAVPADRLERRWLVSNSTTRD